MKLIHYSVTAHAENTVRLHRTEELSRDEYQEWLDEHQADPSDLQQGLHYAAHGVAEEKPKRKRRSAAEIAADKAAEEAAAEPEGEEASEGEAEAEEEAPKKGGRRGKKAAAEPEEQEEAPKRGGRRGKSKPAEEEPGETEVESEVTDSDLTKACSGAAKKIKPAGVKDIIASYNVDKVGELKGDDRQAFLDELDTAVEAAEEEGGY